MAGKRSENMKEIRERSENMKEIREAAVAYSKKMPEDVKIEARSLFESMDTDNDKKISFTEFSKAYERLNVSGDQHLDDKLFKELDVNGDRHLNFEEFVTLFYLVHSKRLLYCNGCQQFLKGLYFTCVPCFDQGQTNVNYCTACYDDDHHREHKDHGDVDVPFVDNYALLLSKAGSSNGAAEATKELSYDALEATLLQPADEAQSVTTQRGQRSTSQRMKNTVVNFGKAFGFQALRNAARQAFGKVTEVADGSSII